MLIKILQKEWLGSHCYKSSASSVSSLVFPWGNTALDLRQTGQGVGSDWDGASKCRKKQQFPGKVHQHIQMIIDTIKDDCRNGHRRSDEKRGLFFVVASKILKDLPTSLLRFSWSMELSLTFCSVWWKVPSVQLDGRVSKMSRGFHTGAWCENVCLIHLVGMVNI